jgi:hypothetical protein
VEKEERINEKEQEQGDEIDREQAIALPNREAMTIIAPPLLGGVVKASPGAAGSDQPITADPQAPTDPISIDDPIKPI